MSAPSGSQWTGRTVVVALAVALVAAAFMAARTGRDALYIQERGVFDLPKAYLGITLFSLPAAALMLGLMRRFGSRGARVIANLVFAIVLVVFARVAQPGGGHLMTALFIAVPLVFGVLFSATWLLAAELLDQAPRPQLGRAYGFIAAASMAGSVAASVLAKLVSRHVEPQALLVIAGGFLAAAAVVLHWAHRRYPVQELHNARRTENPAPADIRSVLRQRYTRLLIGIGALTALVGVLIEFQFYVNAASPKNTGRENADFFATFYLLLSMSALVVQLIAMPRVQKWIGVHGSLQVLPCVLLLPAATAFLSSSGLVRSILRIAEGGLKSSIHRSNWEQAYIAIPRPQRPVAKLLVDGGGARLGEGLAAALLQVWLVFWVRPGSLQGHDTRWITLALAVSMLLWIGLTRALGRTLQLCTAAHPGDMRLDIPLPDT